MKVLKYRFAIHSPDPDKLASFYTEVLNFKKTVKVDRDDEYGYGIEATSGYKLWIAKHSEIMGKATQPFRILLSFYVDSIDSYISNVREFDPSLIVEEPKLYCENIKGEERRVCAFFDPDGNCVQMMQLLSQSGKPTPKSGTI